MLSSWVPGADDHAHFTLQNLPFGIFSTEGEPDRRVGVAISDHVVDLLKLSKAGALDGVAAGSSAFWESVFGSKTLNPFMALTRIHWQGVRARLTDLLVARDPVHEHASASAIQLSLVPMDAVTMHLPANIGDFTDFASSWEHATNMATILQGPEHALPPNWTQQPVAQQGRASSIVVSGTPVRRPCGQVQVDPTDPTAGCMHSASSKLDFELEMAFLVGGLPTECGEPISMADAENHIFGLVLMNNWTARDLQQCERIPMGPLTSKNFATTISPWVVTLDALEPFRCASTCSRASQSDEQPLEYLRDPTYLRSFYDIGLEVQLEMQGDLHSGEGGAVRIATSNFRHGYWTMKQQLVHHTVSGCPVRPGDLMGSGGISGNEKGTYGSLLELTCNGTRPLALDRRPPDVVPTGQQAEEGSRKQTAERETGEKVSQESEIHDPVAEERDQVSERTFLEDGDTVVLTATCESKSPASNAPPQGVQAAGKILRVGFGTCVGKVIPARPFVPPPPAAVVPNGTAEAAANTNVQQGSFGGLFSCFAKPGQPGSTAVDVDAEEIHE